MKQKNIFQRYMQPKHVIERNMKMFGIILTIESIIVITLMVGRYVFDLF